MQRQSEFKVPVPKRQRESTLDNCFGLRTSLVLQRVLTYLCVALGCNTSILEALFYTAFATWHVLSTTYISGAGYVGQVIFSRLIQAITDELLARLPTWHYVWTVSDTQTWFSIENHVNDAQTWFSIENSRRFTITSTTHLDDSTQIALTSNAHHRFVVAWNGRKFGNQICMGSSYSDPEPLRGGEFLLHFKNRLAEFCRQVTT
jgi:hypothetical protein